MFKCIQNLRQIVHAGLGYYNAIKVYFDRNMIKIVQLHVVLANKTRDQAGHDRDRSWGVIYRWTCQAIKRNPNHLQIV